MTNFKGYMGKVLKIDLTSKTFGEFPWTDEDRQRTVGGKIMAADILLKHVRPGMTAFDEDNWVVISTGPLTGCGTPSTARFNMSTISPLTGIITSSNSGGDFGMMLKRCGYDAAVIMGKSDVPVRIHITEETVEFIDASELWGLKVTETQEKLPKKTANIVIGPAGENKVLYAAAFSGERAFGRGGTGAVLGDKNIKAITAKGFKHPEIYDKEELVKFSRKWVKKMLNHPVSGKQVPQLGTAGLVTGMQFHSILATKNFSKGQYDNFEKVSGETLAEEKLIRKSGCTTCPIQCTRRVDSEFGDIKGPELEILGLLGPNILNDDLGKIITWNHEIDEWGMDTISCAGTIAFAMELQEKGMFDSGLEFGKIDNISEMIEKIALRQGVGDELANGSRKMSEKFGGEEFAIQVKGMELAAYEPRHAVAQGLGYAVSNRGGCHLNAGYMVYVEGLGMDLDSLKTSGKAGVTVIFQDLMEAASACGSCLFTTYSVLPAFLFKYPNSPITKAVGWAFGALGPVYPLVERITFLLKFYLPFVYHTKAVELATGMDFKVGDFLMAGDRGYNMERVANIILGQRAGADTLPKRLTDVAQDPSNPATKVPLDILLKDYYKNRRWVDGVPTKKQLKYLGIDVPPHDAYPYNY